MRKLIPALAGMALLGCTDDPTDVRPTTLEFEVVTADAFFDGKHFICEYDLTVRATGGRAAHWLGGYEFTYSKGALVDEINLSREDVAARIGADPVEGGQTITRSGLAVFWKDPFYDVHRFDWTSAGDTLTDSVRIDCF